MKKEISNEKNNNNDNNDFYNNILENQIQKRSFLTNIPSNIKDNIKNKQSLGKLKQLKEKENALSKNINKIKNKRTELSEISFKNISEAEIENNMLNDNLKNIGSLEKNLTIKLEEVKEQIKTLSKKLDGSPNNNMKKMNKIEKNSNFQIIEKQLLYHNNLRIKEIEKQYKKHKKENLSIDLNKQKEEYLKNKKQEENEIIIKRKNETEKMMKENKEDIYPVKDIQKCLYFQMEKKFKERENKLIHDITTERKVKNMIYKQNINLKNEKRYFQEYKQNLDKRALEQKNNMKKLWHSRSMILRNYQNLNNIKTFEKEIKENIEMNINNKKVDIKKFCKNIKLPPINEKLKEQTILRQLNIQNMKGKERINFVNNKYKKKSLKIINAFRNLDYGKNNAIKKEKKLLVNMTNSKQNKKLNYISRENLRNENPKNLLIPNSKTFKDNIKKKRNPNEINYLKDLNDTKKIKFHRWNEFLSNKKNKKEKKIDIDGINNINKKIENLDENARMKKQIINLNGGFENDIKLGNEYSGILIDSIQGKLTILDEIYHGN